MEIKKDYFPTAKAPDIAKKKVMQYVYWSKKNLSKRFYFYRIYAPAFLLLFIMIWWLAFYNIELKVGNRIQNKTVSNEKQQLLAENPAIRNFVENKEGSAENKNISILPETTSLDNDTLMKNSPVVDNADLASPITIETRWNNTGIEAVTNIANEPSAVSLSSPEPTLDQQINEIEKLMNDISSIASQEESLF